MAAFKLTDFPAFAVESLDQKKLGYRINILIARLCFRGIYFPMMGRMAWIKMFAENRRTIFSLMKEGFRGRRPKVDLPKAIAAIQDSKAGHA